MARFLYIATMESHIRAFHIPYILELRKRGHTIDIAVNTKSNINEATNTFCVNFSRRIITLRNFKAYFQLKKIIDNGKYDIIHTHTPIASVLSRLIAKRNDAKVVYTAHGFHFYTGSSIFSKLVFYPLEKFLSQYTDLLITINKEDYSIASKNFKSKRIIKINGVGINLKEIKSKTYSYTHNTSLVGVKKIISVGELNKNKNHKVVIKALSLIKNKNIHYYICGIGKKEKSLKKLSKKLNLAGNVHFLGYQNDVIKLLKSADLFVFPSFREGLSLALIEAMSIGLPILCSNIRGNVDLITNDKNGNLFKPNDYKQLSVLIKKLLYDKNISHKYSLENSVRIDNYNIDTILPIIFNEYSRLLDGGL